MNRCKCSQLAHDFFGCCNDGRGNEFAAYTAEIVNPLKARIKELESALERAAKEAEIRGMEAAREITKACGKGQIFTAEAAGYRMAVRDEIRDALTVEIARMKGEEK